MGGYMELVHIIKEIERKQFLAKVQRRFLAVFATLRDQDLQCKNIHATQTSRHISHIE